MNLKYRSIDREKLYRSSQRWDVVGNALLIPATMIGVPLAVILVLSLFGDVSNSSLFYSVEFLVGLAAVAVLYIAAGWALSVSEKKLAEYHLSGADPLGSHLEKDDDK